MHIHARLIFQMYEIIQNSVRSQPSPLQILSFVREVTAVFFEIVQTHKHKVRKNFESCYVTAGGTYSCHRTSKGRNMLHYWLNKIPVKQNIRLEL